jgi:hypothetical protein
MKAMVLSKSNLAMLALTIAWEAANQPFSTRSKSISFPE